MDLPLKTLVTPQSTRVFCGYRLPAMDRERFFQELSNTFMPGTPLFLAPLGLSAYVAATLDFPDSEAMPDEAALIVYSSLPDYSWGRERSLPGRMYTHSHAGVFDMQRSGGQFPGPLHEPNIRTPGDRWSWYVFDRGIDWQYGSTRMVMLRGSGLNPIHSAVHTCVVAAADSLESVGVDQLIVVATATYAILWIHSAEPLSDDLLALKLWPSELIPERDLNATVVRMITMMEGPPISGAGAYTFRFARDPRYFV